uniref:Uncharacterized protein n=1 Tax=Anopheles coluzzii TaxID=1518534 RepID=A0A8W7Q0C3_ANOCL
MTATASGVKAGSPMRVRSPYANFMLSTMRCQLSGSVALMFAYPSSTRSIKFCTVPLPGTTIEWTRSPAASVTVSGASQRDGQQKATAQAHTLRAGHAFAEQRCDGSVGGGTILAQDLGPDRGTLGTVCDDRTVQSCKISILPDRRGSYVASMRVDIGVPRAWRTIAVSAANPPSDAACTQTCPRASSPAITTGSNPFSYSIDIGAS